RRPDFHGGDFAVAGALRPLAVFRLVFLGEPDIEHGAEYRVAGAAAGGDDDALARLDVHGAGLGPVGVVDFDGGDAGDAAGQRALTMNFRHLLLQQDFDAHALRGLLQRPDETGAPRWRCGLIGPAHHVQPGAVAVEAIGSAAVCLPLDAV